MVQTSHAQVFERVVKKQENGKELAYSPAKHTHIQLSIQLVKRFPLPHSHSLMVCGKCSGRDTVPKVYCRFIFFFSFFVYLFLSPILPVYC